MLLKNCRLIPELSGGATFEIADIRIRNGRIESVSKAGAEVADPEEIVDIGGSTVLPGFIDLHVHIGLSAGSVLEDNTKSVATQVLDAMRYAQNTLKAGFTTIRDAGSSNGVAIALRDCIRAGTVLGPDIIASGKVLTPVEIGNDFFRDLYAEFSGEGEAARLAREEFKQGADYIKGMGSGAFMNPGGEPGSMIAFDEELKAISRVAILKNSYVAIHAHGAGAIKQAIRCNVRTIEHGSFVDEEGIELLKSENAYLIPTIIGLFTWDEQTRNDPSEWRRIEPLLEQIEKSMKACYRAGLKLGFGTDMGVPDCFHGDNGKEFLIRHDLIGMKPLDILLQATRYSAEIAMIDQEVGTVEKGKKANLVVVAGDPLTDIKCVVDSILRVYKEGMEVRL
jgi:imidazolonepropionase-like amidohydrolase